MYTYLYHTDLYCQNSLYLEESNIIWTVPENGHSRYLRKHKSYKKNVMNKALL